MSFQKSTVWFWKKGINNVEKIGVKIDSMRFRNNMLGTMWSQNLHK